MATEVTAETQPSWDTSEPYNIEYDQPPIETLEIPADFEPLPEEYSVPPPPTFPDSVEEETGSDSESNKQQISKQWKEFVDMIAEGANKSLVSLLRNAVLLQLTEEEIVIGSQNLDVFSEDKRRIIERHAHHFFSKDIAISYQEAATGLDISLKEISDLEKEKQLEEKKRIAGQDAKVLQIRQVFPDAEIKHITVLEE